MKGRWTISIPEKGRYKIYKVYRLRDDRDADEEANREYARNYFTVVKGDAEAYAELLNREEEDRHE